jgi:predicted phosphohydrolase
MSIWALSDPHLSLGNPSKDMQVFGADWANYPQKIEENWKDSIKAEDLVLLPGDISWAKSLQEAQKDLAWIDSLPGTKLILKGNHDYWWASNAKMTAAMPPSIHFLYNNAFTWNDVTIGGTRLWDTQEYNFNEFIEFKENPKARKEAPPSIEETEALFEKELERLKLSLGCLDPKAKLRIALTHYPPIGADLAPSRTSSILEAFHIDICIFGHLHSVRKNSLPFGKAQGIDYIFASADYIEFKPIQISV